MRLRRALFALTLAALFPVPLSAQNLNQSFNLRDLLVDFVRQGITLAPPPAGSTFPSHEAHFIGSNFREQELAFQQFTTGFANQLSSFPLASSAGGFTYTFDPSLGTFTRAAASFGPIYAERADTIGGGRFNVGMNFSHFTFDHVNDLDLHRGDIPLVFTHQDVNNDGSNLQPFFEGDVITARLFLRLDSDVTAFVLTYGVSDRFDIGAAIPIVRVSVDAQMKASIDRLATGGSPSTAGIHRFPNNRDSESLRASGNASGVGDVVVRGKFRVTSSPRVGLALGADARLPTGDEQNLLGTGATQVKAYVIGSAHLGPLSPHVNGGYTWSIHPSRGLNVPDEISYTGGFDWAFSPRLTFAADVIGRTFRNTQVVQVVQETFTANTNPDSTAPPTLRTAVLPRLSATTGNVDTLLGSVGFKINPLGNLLLTVNGLFSINKKGLRDDFTPLVGVDYSF